MPTKAFRLPATGHQPPAPWPLRFHLVCALFLPLLLGGIACLHWAAPTLPAAFLTGALLGAAAALFAARCAAGRGRA